jgi:hypothetical protein
MDENLMSLYGSDNIVVKDIGFGSQICSFPGCLPWDRIVLKLMISNTLLRSRVARASLICPVRS